MKKLIALVLALICVLALVGCSKNFDDKPTITGFIKEIHDDHILIATSTAEGHPYGASFDISINTKDCDEIYNPLTVGDEIIVYYDGNITESKPSQIDTVYAIKLKVKANFDSGSDLAAQFPRFMAKILEIHDNYILVEPEVGMEELKSADKFEIPLDDVDNSTELQVDDSVIIVYDGEILETYPAKLGEVYSVGKAIIIPVDNSKEAAPNEAIGAYTYEELSEMPANELLDLFIQNGLVINDDLKASYTEEELQKLFKENFHLWHTGVSAHSHTMYCDLAEQTKEIYDKITETKK